MAQEMAKADRRGIDGQLRHEAAHVVVERERAASREERHGRGRELLRERAGVHDGRWRDRRALLEARHAIALREHEAPVADHADRATGRIGLVVGGEERVHAGGLGGGSAAIAGSAAARTRAARAIITATVSFTKWEIFRRPLAALLLQACGTPSATIETSRGENLMLLGYDPVGYFTDGKPVRGKHTIAATHDGRTYYFASPEHRATFVASPTRYEPQYGGFVPTARLTR
jgi:YHS domain-containing protein